MRFGVFGLAVICGALCTQYVASVWAARHAHMPLASLALAVVTFGLCRWGSVVWQRAFLRELRGV